jgi:hypothetical protein
MNSNQNNRGRLNPAMEEAIARALGKNKPKAVETQSQQSETGKETKMETNVNKEVNAELTNGTSSETDKVLPDTLSQGNEAGVNEKPLSVEVEEKLDTVLESLVTEKVTDTETQSQQETVPEQETAQPQTKEDKMKNEIMKQYPGINLDTVEEIIFIRESVKAGKISQEEIVIEMKHLVTKRGDLNVAAIFEEYKSHLTVEGWSILKNKCEGMADVADEIKEAIKTNYINKAKAIAPWVIGGAVVAGAGYLAYKYFTSQSEAEGIVTAVMGEGAGEVASGVAGAIAGYFA